MIIATGAVQASGWDFGVKLGLNQTTLTKIGSTQYINKINGTNSITAGIFAENQLGNFYGLCFEAAYSKRKTGLILDPNAVSWFYYYDISGMDDIPFNIETNFIDLSALFKFFPLTVNGAVPYLYGGPVFSVLVAGYKKPTSSNLLFEREDVNSPATAIGYSLGGGIEFNVKGLKSSLDIRMIRTLNGLTYYQKKSGYISYPPLPYSDEKYRNNFISVMLGVSLFRL